MNVPPERPQAREPLNRALGARLRIPVNLVKHKEGETTLIVPGASLTMDPPPTSPVFYNPAASLNRDVSVAVTAASGAETFCDSMAGVGARGLRAAKEVESIDRVELVDFNPDALAIAKRAALLNGVAQMRVYTI